MARALVCGCVLAAGVSLVAQAPYTVTPSFTSTPFLSIGTTPAAAGAIRLPNAATISFRNAANSGDVTAFTVDASNYITLGPGGGNIQLSGPTFFASDNTFDIGASSSVRPRTGYFATSVIVGSNVSISTGGLIMGNLVSSTTNIAINSGFGTSPAMAGVNGTWAARVNVGTGGVATAGVLTLSTATTGWNCDVNNLTAAAAHRADNTRQTASTTTTVTVENQTTSTGAAVAWAASDIITLKCAAY